MTKICPRCRKDLPVESFRWKTSARKVRQSYCIECNRAANKEHYQNNKDLYAAKQRDYRKDGRERFAKYGITPEQYQQYLDDQGGMCGLCGKKEARVIDHDHLTGKVRGVLCVGCNCGLGLLGDSIEGLERAVKYLAPSSMG